MNLHSMTPATRLALWLVPVEHGSTHSNNDRGVSQSVRSQLVVVSKRCLSHLSLIEDCLDLSVQMDAILHCKAEDLEDYYGLLGCDELSSSEQILAEYKVRAMECHPDKNPDNPQAVQDFQKLQEAKEVLTNENARNNYNLWRRSKITIPFRDWQALGDSVKASMHWAVKTKKEPMLKDRADSPLLSPQDAVCQTEVPAAEIQFPETVNTPSENYSHLHFRWAAGTPSGLLRKFRNYEI